MSPSRDPDDEGWVSRRERTRSLPYFLAYVLVALGLAAVAFALANVYAPSALNPGQITPDPLFGLSFIAGGGIGLVLLGVLLYVFASNADL